MKARSRSKAIQGLLAGTLTLLVPARSDVRVEEAGGALLEAWVEEAESGGLDLRDRRHVLGRLAHSPSSRVRSRVAHAAGALCRRDPVAGLSLLRQLSRDPAREVRAASARGLARFLEHAPGPLRASVESDWVNSPGADERVALALALAAVTPDWLTDLALAELAVDPRPRVRRAALYAVRRRLPAEPAAYLELAARHVTDPDRKVRQRARRALRDALPRAAVAALRPTRDAMRASRRRLERALRRS